MKKGIAVKGGGYNGVFILTDTGKEAASHVSRRAALAAGLAGHDFIEESIIRLARVFNVSTDFILGVTEIPDKKHYDIAELGLSTEAAKNLYTGKVNTDVVKRLLENPRFALVTHMIEQYLDDTVARGYVAHNQLITAMNKLMLEQKVPEAVKTARAYNSLKIPPYQADRVNIEITFMAAVREVKKEAWSDMVAFQELYAKDIKQITQHVTKGQDHCKDQDFLSEICGFCDRHDCDSREFRPGGIG